MVRLEFRKSSVRVRPLKFVDVHDIEVAEESSLCVMLGIHLIGHCEVDECGLER